MSKFSRDAISRRSQELGIDAPHGPVGEQKMRHFYGASGCVSKVGSDISEIKLGIDRASREMYECVNRREFYAARMAVCRMEDLAYQAKVSLLLAEGVDAVRLEREARK